MRDYAVQIARLRECASNSHEVHLKCGAYLSGVCAKTRDIRMQDAADAIEELLAELVTTRNQLPKWVSVEERLPEQGERVLVSNGGFICESYLSQSGKWQRGGVDMFFMTPTHWMPLLKPPKEVE